MEIIIIVIAAVVGVIGGLSIDSSSSCSCVWTELGKVLVSPQFALWSLMFGTIMVAVVGFGLLMLVFGGLPEEKERGSSDQG